MDKKTLLFTSSVCGVISLIGYFASYRYSQASKRNKELIECMKQSKALPADKSVLKQFERVRKEQTTLESPLVLI